MGARWTRKFGTGLAVLCCAGVAFAALSAGALDTTFDGDGVALHPAGHRAVFLAAAQQSDGKTVAVGRDAYSIDLDPATVPGWKIRRYNTDGSLDTSFGSGGVTTVFGQYEDWREDEPLDVAVDSLDRIVIVGRVFSPAGGGGGKKGKKRGGNQNLVGRATVVRLTASGAPDSNFGDEGVVQQDFADNTSGPIANSVLVDASDGVYVGGFADMPYEVEEQGRGKKIRVVTRYYTRAFLIRYDDSGALVGSFGDGGVLLDEDTYDGALDRRERLLGGTLAFQSDGSLLAAAWSRPGDSSSVEDSVHVVRRYDADGARDASFEIEEPGTHLVSHLGVDSQDRIVLAMNDYPPPFQYQAGLIARYGANGTLDTGFGINGYRPLEVQEPGDIYAGQLALDALDRVVLSAAQSPSVGATTYDALTIRLDANGDPDASYGGDGYGDRLFPGDISTAWEAARRVLVDGQGDVVVVGSRYDPVSGTNAAWIARWCGD